MAGIDKLRVDYGDKGPVGKNDDKRSGGGPKTPEAAAPTRANKPVSSSENDFTSEVSDASRATRKNSGE